MLMMRTLLATVCCIFGSWGLVIELNFGSDFEHKVWSRFWSWSSGKIFELEFGQHFAAGNDICRVMKLNLGCDTLVSWTQPSGQLCLWQCCICIMLYNKDKKGYNRRLIWYSYLVLGTRSAAKFEKVPSTSFDSSSFGILKNKWLISNFEAEIRSHLLHYRRGGCIF